MLFYNSFIVYFGMYFVKKKKKIIKFIGNFHLKLEKFQYCTGFWKLFGGNKLISK